MSLLDDLLVIGLAFFSSMIYSVGWCFLAYLDSLGPILVSIFGLLASEWTSLLTSSSFLSCVMISELECVFSLFYNSTSKCNFVFTSCDSVDTKTCCSFPTWLEASSLIGIPS